MESEKELIIDAKDNIKPSDIEKFIYKNIAHSNIIFTAFDYEYSDDIFPSFTLGLSPKGEPDSTRVPRIAEFIDFIIQEKNMGRAISLTAKQVYV